VLSESVPATSVRRLSILVCDDEARFRAMLEQVLVDEGHDVKTVPDGHAAIAALERGGFDLVITDMRMPGVDGFAVLDAARRTPAAPAVVAITGYASIDETVLAIRHGAQDYLAKPFPIDRLLEVVATVTRDRPRAPNRPAPPEPVQGFVGASEPMRAVHARLLRFAPLDATVLIQGETGTGKELAAAALHDLSPRKHAALVRVNCANIERTLFESALFGHVRGSFTGAVADKDGLFHAAQGGTIFLDEVGEIPLDLQAKLLRAIERKEFLRVGGTAPERVDVRIVAATNRDLETQAKRGTFREDLYFRLSGFVLEIPPLRERRDDVPLLVANFLVRFAREQKKPEPTISEDALGRLAAYDWPGNVRELENVVRALVACATSDSLGTADLPPRIAALAPEDLGTAALPLDYHAAKEIVVSAFERRYFVELVQKHGANLSTAARAAGLDRKSLREKLRKLGLKIEGRETPPP
jgi:DNA-binding NtrC family response regulator